MDLNITIDKNGKNPIYKQIVEGILEGVEEQTIQYGSKLPTERELAQEFEISRGTVKKAFEELEKLGVIKIIWGSGAYIIKHNTVFDDSEDEVNLVSQLINTLKLKNFTHFESENFMQIHLAKKAGAKKVNIAAIDCNMESLRIFKKQLAYITELNCFLFLLEDVKAFKNPKEIFDEFDIIFSTTSHYEELSLLLPENAERIMKAAVSPDKDTLVKLLKVTDFNHTGILSKSYRFKEIVNNNLASYGQRIAEKNCIYEKWADAQAFEKFIMDKQVLIMPPIYTMDLKAEIYEEIIRFITNGGQIITFNYTIEKGSIIYIEERISNILYNFKGW